MKPFALIFFIFLGCTVLAQQQQAIHFSANFGSNKLELHKSYFSSFNKDSVQFSALKFYVGQFNFYNNNKKVFSLNKYFLIDVMADSLCRFTIPKNILYNSITFLLGVDSVTNAKPSFKDDLDPRKGMYWAWHSGYINFKLEGKSPVCSTLNNAFQFHLGGFGKNKLAAKTVALQAKKASTLFIQFNAEQFINTVDLKTSNLIMTPSWQAVNLNDIAAKCFLLANQ